MQLAEKEIEDLIFRDLKNNNGKSLCEKGLILPIYHRAVRASNAKLFNVRWYRQLNIEPYGIIDIVGFYRYKGIMYADLLELKSVPIESSDFDQIFRYKKGIEVYTHQTFKSIAIEVNCILVGSGYHTGCYIQNNSDILVSEFTYSLDGFSFKTHNQYSAWGVTNDDHCSWRNKVKTNPQPLVRLKQNGWS